MWAVVVLKCKKEIRADVFSSAIINTMKETGNRCWNRLDVLLCAAGSTVFVHEEVRGLLFLSLRRLTTHSFIKTPPFVIALDFNRSAPSHTQSSD